MATLPTDLTKVNFDAATDDPSAARAEFASNVDKVNQLLAGFGPFWDASAGDGLTVSSSVASVDLATNSGLEFSAGKILAKVTAAVSGILLSANGLEVDIVGTTTDPTPDLAADWVLTGDVSAGLLKKVQLDKLSSVGGIEIFTTSGTFTQPTGVTRVRVICVGGGGGGGGSSTGGTDSGGGGGGAEYVEAIVNISGNITVTTGTGGIGGIAASAGSAGVDSTFGALVTANSGSGGGAGSGGLGAGGAAGTGGIMTGDRLIIEDGVAGSIGSGTTGGNAGYKGWAGAQAIGPVGATGTNGNAGTEFGDGGSGAGASNPGGTGGTGANGVVIVMF